MVEPSSQGLVRCVAEDAARGLVQGLGEIPQHGRFGWTDAEAQGFGAGVGAGELRAERYQRYWIASVEALSAYLSCSPGALKPSA